MTNPTLKDLGWSPFFATQPDASGGTDGVPMRIASVQRNKATGLSEQGDQRLIYPPGLSAGDVAVGDWVMVDPDTHVIRTILDRSSKLSRRAAGIEAKSQLLAANIDTLFITTSCNEDFNPARIERYVVLALDAGVSPVLVLTKADKAEDTQSYLQQAQEISNKFEAILIINAKDPDQSDRLRHWCGPGRTVAFVGSSGVGKSTLINALTGSEQSTADIREDDAKGRHTTTARSLHFATGGGMVIDMPGMRELGLHDVAGGIDVLFDDITELATQCKFRDCAHISEPGCAVLAAIKAGTLDEARVERWRKLRAEDQLNSETMGQTRRRAREITRQHKAVQAAQGRFKGKPGGKNKSGK
ncbi:Putative ribosome biogenesis GTPase RsgA [Thalassovita gelatinovora]|uniref:Small ribosomal subunit biogenesis GTPase RsgA n=1 Tax=Thalassovita gelatinovora TaxID=53501 RepID=A0A0P1FX43_THAGE|nr:ribosome small subunit-dependent GTPase A [Thalassovita gelatinovora]CUH66191.1 Putative ribosome biogenesis GTPase RsgA [Thalassovita gelatinovora]SEQ21596.1 ribosome biogenesis GTPase [Thalassovita gelatinovora]